jgi:hypothetical protein
VQSSLTLSYSIHLKVTPPLPLVSTDLSPTMTALVGVTCQKTPTNTAKQRCRSGCLDSDRSAGTTDSEKPDKLDLSRGRCL